MLPTYSLLSLAALVAPALAAGGKYAVTDVYQGEKFFDSWKFFTGNDPTKGFVDYVDRTEAERLKIAEATPERVRFGVDSSGIVEAGARGRKSVRIESTKTWSNGLFMVDIQHMPGNTCGVWPAFWLLGTGRKWPEDGEIDIIEGVNKNKFNKFVLHTGDNCLATAAGTGFLAEADCSVHTSTVGCVVEDQRDVSFGDGFNANKGGIYALEWTDDQLQIWFFPRNAIPKSALTDSPDPAADFGAPQARIGNPSCEVKRHFGNQKLIFNTALCGEWAGQVFLTDGCPSTGGMDQFGSCNSYVANNPKEFADAYWEINSVKVFQVGGQPDSPAVNPPKPSVEPPKTPTPSVEPPKAPEPSKEPEKTTKPSEEPPKTPKPSEEPPKASTESTEQPKSPPSEPTSVKPTETPGKEPTVTPPVEVPSLTSTETTSTTKSSTTSSSDETKEPTVPAEKPSLTSTSTTTTESKTTVKPTGEKTTTKPTEAPAPTAGGSTCGAGSSGAENGMSLPAYIRSSIEKDQSCVPATSTVLPGNGTELPSNTNPTGAYPTNTGSGGMYPTGPATETLPGTASGSPSGTGTGGQNPTNPPMEYDGFAAAFQRPSSWFVLAGAIVAGVGSLMV